MAPTSSNIVTGGRGKDWIRWTVSVLLGCCIGILFFYTTGQMSSYETSYPRAFHPPAPVKNSTANGETNSMQSSLYKGSLEFFNKLPKVRVPSINCAALFEGIEKEVQNAKSLMKSSPKKIIPDKDILNDASNCDKFVRDRQYIMSTLSREEEEYPIAYSMVVFKEVEQVERLLRAIYRPQNLYCFHVDKKSPENFYIAVRQISNCFENVFIASKRIDVQWGQYSVLEADLICMEELLKKSRKWKYFINLTGQEFPLKTNLELVKILKTYNGANDIEGTVKRRNMNRFKDLPTPPYNITPMKGSVHIVASRPFVDFVLNDPKAKEFHEWDKKAGIPDESFFTTLNHNPQLGAPGAFTGKDPETHPEKKPFNTRFKNWGDWPFDYPCHGKRVRMVCIFGIGDLPLLMQRKEFFSNKFYLDYEPLAYDCMEELHYNRTMAAYMLPFDNSYYKNLSYVRNHVKVKW
ncbi:beta-1,3-galactosyl-O-glycosyl-glycoprotein beta-1,6-N-acetylglucosaminyltransferase 3 [Lingula anatina]|uniref:Beta-1,3-galactosyl-O-glycosyl-glycoprotein beta-1,6-N-acetylglucosaminyltransferase 3 n=1 Tax=Lingula anatina TaxID=7574 RepID=A0A1S3J731_LINAN|nr:beta-1,3-galactosyl-O-glycosyl-glycoprotein beta-1,6-N-acetylglucosaminyltransferase 3 [Lingula anatina]XP_013406221.1 beta-1,3-galactosyl-O-glycosyl-glycoprotein beta-1,6-N-acetylglucosaminyltransferase 3 [Lingula anatina]XP_013406222.1 beta-1,3-galactosyl-O-glycosyl-glycoprotein beta-1,6-N-acetylglucosaminyltransferase 3 [Lingula anatina]|eukprot:XP_013406220.1 beta-1,3-galactosyl-O-glycosyl-glycoprotein beta-1,6-N-acetylglucosaminyltransferase 3 [Lingula anatina]